MCYMPNAKCYVLGELYFGTRYPATNLLKILNTSHTLYYLLPSTKCATTGSLLLVSYNVPLVEGMEVPVIETACFMA